MEGAYCPIAPVMQRIYLLIGLVVVLFAMGALMPQPCAKGCNVILIMMDTLSAKHMEIYGYERSTMPATSAFFDKGVVFEEATSNAPWTLPSFSSLYFSDVASHITYADLEKGARPNLIQTLRDNGVAIHAIVPGTDNFIFDGITRVYDSSELTGTEYASPFRQGEEKAQALFASGQPFFLLLHTFQVHDPYRPSAPFNETYGKSEEYETVTMEDLLEEYTDRTPDQERVDLFRLRYDQQLRQTDEDIARFLQSLSPELLKRTVVILAADHGEAFNEHDSLFHANALFEEELHIPLMMRVPGVSAGRISAPVSLLDIAPTILALGNIEAPSGFLGENLMPIMRGKQLEDRVIPYVNGRPFFLAWTPGDSPFFASLEAAGAVGTTHPIVDAASVGVRIGSQKAFMQKIPASHAGLHWYDLASDPNESRNLAEDSTRTMPVNLEEALHALLPDLSI